MGSSWLAKVRSSHTRFVQANARKGSDPVAAALCFYKGLKVYPEPKALIGIYENTVPENVLKLLAQMVAQDKDLKVGSFGGSGPGSDSGEAIE